MRHIHKAIFSVSLFIMVIGTTALAHAMSKPVDMKKLGVAISRARTGETSSIRTEAAQHLAELTQDIDANEISDRFLYDLISLLDSPDDSVRYWVARSLGNLGKRAVSAVPRLQRLLDETDCLPGSKTSASGVRLALRQMGAQPATSVCESKSK